MRHHARGVSMVELLVGVAAGLIVVAAAATLWAAQLREQRALRLEARLMHDLGATADLVARDLRRAGYWGDATAGVSAGGAPARSNPYAEVTPSATAVAFSYSRDAAENHLVEADESFGWRLHAGAVELLLGSGGWQAATDASLLVVTAFDVAPTVDEIDLGALCTKPCDAASVSAGTCPPRQQVRSLVVRIAGHAAGDPRVARTVEARARLRNDRVVGACAA